MRVSDKYVQPSREWICRGPAPPPALRQALPCAWTWSPLESLSAIRAQTGHKSLPMVRKYIHGSSLFRENAPADVGL